MGASYFLGDAFPDDIPPRRIVSLVPSQTELLADLGLDEEVVGITRFCVHPKDRKSHKTIVGGTKSINIERVAALTPDLIIANKEENERDQVEALSQIAPVFVTDVSSVDEGQLMIRDVGELVGRPQQAAALSADIERQFCSTARFKPIRTAYLIWKDPYMTIGGDTFISDIMRCGGFENAFSDKARYPEVTLENLASTNLDLILLSSEPYPFKEKHTSEIQQKTGIQTELVDGEMFSWYGSRMRLAADYLSKFRTMLKQEKPHPDTSA